MASIVRYRVTIRLIDGVERDCGNTFYVAETEWGAYVTAADDAARAATPIGALVAKYVAMTLAPLVAVEATVEYLADPAPDIPANTILRGNKLQFFHKNAGRGHDFSIPARNQAHFTQDDTTLNVSITTPTAMTDFKDAYESVVVDAYGNSGVILKARVVD